MTQKDKDMEYRYYMGLAAQASAIGDQILASAWIGTAQQFKTKKGK